MCMTSKISTVEVHILRKADQGDQTKVPPGQEQGYIALGGRRGTKLRADGQKPDLRRRRSGVRMAPGFIPAPLPEF